MHRTWRVSWCGLGLMLALTRCGSDGTSERDASRPDAEIVNTPDADIVDARTDAAIADAARDATSDATDVSASVPTEPPDDVLSRPLVDGTRASDESILGLVAAWSTSPSVETAAAHRLAETTARVALRAAGSDAADRLVAAYDTIAPFDDVTRGVVLRLLGEVESASSLALLVRAATWTPGPPSGEHTTVAPPGVIAQLAAMHALASRVLDGSSDAQAALLTMLGHPNAQVRELAVMHVFMALPRRQARREALARLPINERWRVYEVRP
jgi:hypothetical protein